MNIDVLFAAMPVTALSEAVPWYEKFFGRAPDIVPNDQEVMWKVVEAGWLYVIEDGPRAGQTVVTLSFPNLDEAIAQVRERGLQPGPIERVGDEGIKAFLTDPDGNSVAMLEVTAAGA